VRTDPRDLPSHKAFGRFVDWCGYTLLAMGSVVAVTLIAGKLLRPIPLGAGLGIVLALMTPACVCLGIAWLHFRTAARLRKAEIQQGLITYPNAILRFMDEHPYRFGFTVTAVALLMALVWTMLEHR
jgi:hypothetical protein